VQALAKRREAGGEVLFRTDIGNMDHFDTALEFTLMSRASLTTAPAKRFGYAERGGALRDRWTRI
jgi:hypothetical protein